MVVAATPTLRLTTPMLKSASRPSSSPPGPQVFQPGTSQDQVFEDTKHLVQSAVDGYNVCIFAYGQTGSGKTFTIYGNERDPGLTPRGVAELFRIINRDGGKYTFSVSVYMLELYQVRNWRSN